MFSLVVLRKRIKEFMLAQNNKELELFDKSKAPCNTCLYALTLTNDCDACHEPVDGKCEAYRNDV